MIKCRPEALPKDTQSKLAQFLGSGLCDTLAEVAEAKMKTHACNAIPSAVQAAELSAEPKLILTNLELQKAGRYAVFLSVLAELRTQKTPFETVKFS